jgi:hypothetical protein
MSDVCDPHDTEDHPVVDATPSNKIVVETAHGAVVVAVVVVAVHACSNRIPPINVDTDDPIATLQISNTDTFISSVTPDVSTREYTKGVDSIPLDDVSTVPIFEPPTHTVTVPPQNEVGEDIHTE